MRWHLAARIPAARTSAARPTGVRSNVGGGPAGMHLPPVLPYVSQVPLRVLDVAQAVNTVLGQMSRDPLTVHYTREKGLENPSW
jgi:hypothetical protein